MLFINNFIQKIFEFSANCFFTDKNVIKYCDLVSFFMSKMFLCQKFLPNSPDFSANFLEFSIDFSLKP